jgi:hypothetical protein
MKKTKKITMLIMAVVTSLAIQSSIAAAASSDDDIINILKENPELFKTNQIFTSQIRALGWGIIWLLTSLASSVAKMYDKCFEFIDFTNYGKVNEYINSWKPVIIALVCASIFFMGVLLVVNYEKKPKLLINICLLVLVLSSGSYLINQMNNFLSNDARSAIIGNNNQSSGVVYETIGTGLHDLLYLDDKVGLTNLNKTTDGKKNASFTNDDFTKNDFDIMTVNDLVKPSQVKEESKPVVENHLECLIENGTKKFALIKNSSGMLITHFLNEYYYRYSIDWVPIILELLSLFIIYLFMSYKVIRTIWDIAMHRLLAALYATNLNNSQKLLKILDSIKDSYIILIITMIMIKFYLMSCKFISSWNVNGVIKGFILLFIAFSVIDGPNIIQKLTGIDAGASEGAGKMMTLFYGTQMFNGGFRMLKDTATGAFHFATKHTGIDKIKSQQDKASFEANDSNHSSDSKNTNEHGKNQKDANNNTQKDSNQKDSNQKDTNQKDTNQKDTNQKDTNQKDANKGASSGNNGKFNANHIDEEKGKNGNKGCDENTLKGKSDKLNGFDPNKQDKSDSALKKFDQSSVASDVNNKKAPVPDISKNSILNKPQSSGEYTKKRNDNQTKDKDSENAQLSSKTGNMKFERKLNAQNLNNPINKKERK